MDPDVSVYNYMDTFFCCIVKKDKRCEEMVSEHMLVHLCSGELDLITPDKKYHLKKGDSFFIKRNHLVKKIKQPSKSGEPFKGLFLQLKAPFLKKMINELKITVPLVNSPQTAKSVYIMLEKHPFLNGLFSGRGFRPLHRTQPVLIQKRFRPDIPHDTEPLDCETAVGRSQTPD